MVTMSVWTAWRTSLRACVRRAWAAFSAALRMSWSRWSGARPAGSPRSSKRPRRSSRAPLSRATLELGFSAVACCRAGERVLERVLGLAELGRGVDGLGLFVGECCGRRLDGVLGLGERLTQFLVVVDVVEAVVVSRGAGVLRCGRGGFGGAEGVV